VHCQVQALQPTLPTERVSHELQMRSLPELYKVYILHKWHTHTHYARTHR